MRSLRIWFVSHTAELGGAERSMLSLIGRLDRDRVRPTVLLPWEGPVIAELDRLGVEHLQAPLEWWIRPSGGLGAPRMPARERVERLRSLLREGDFPAVVHTNTSVVGDAAVAALEEGLPHLWHVQEILSTHPDLDSPTPLPAFYWLQAELSDRLVPISSSVRGPMLQTVPDDRFEVIHHGVEPEPYRSATPAGLRQELRLPAGAVLAGTLASLIPLKNHAGLLTSAELACREAPDLHFVLAGPGSENAVTRLQADILRRGLGGRVHYLGVRSDVPAVLADLDLLVVPSVTEGFSLITIEALAAGVPVVATDCGGPGEILAGSEAGVVVPVDDMAALAREVIALARDGDRRHRMRAAARRRVEERFTVDRQARAFERLYLEVTSRPRERTAEERARTRALAEMHYRLLEAQEALGAARREIARRERSLSWRLTRPLRLLRPAPPAGRKRPAGR